MISDASILDQIQQRHSSEQLTPESPTQQQIERLLEVASYVLDRHRAAPWKFFVVRGKAREELGCVMAEALRRRLENPSSEEAQARLEKERRKPLRAPVIIAVTMSGAQSLPGPLMENIKVVATSAQNMQFAAEEMGLTTLWRTGDAAYAPLVKRWFGLTPDDRIVAFVYVGLARLLRQTPVPTRFSAQATRFS